MSDLDLSAAYKAATDAYWPTVGQYISNRERIEAILAAAAPVIETQVRAQIVDALEQVASDRSYDSDESITEAYLDAAVIARGESS